MPSHFAERHGLIVIIALGESIVAIGAGVEGDVTLAVVAAAAVGITVAACAVVALLRRRGDRRRAPALERQAGSRAERDRARLLLPPALPDGGGDRARGARHEEDASGTRATRSSSYRPSRCWEASALYLLAHVAFRLRNIRTLNIPRLVTAALFAGADPARDRDHGARHLSRSSRASRRRSWASRPCATPRSGSTSATGWSSAPPSDPSPRKGLRGLGRRGLRPRAGSLPAGGGRGPRASSPAPGCSTWPRAPACSRGR